MAEPGPLHRFFARADDVSSTGSSVSAFLSTLIPALIVAVVMLIGFILLRKSQRRTYMPEPTLAICATGKKPPTALPALGTGLSLFLLFVGCCITWPILFPVNATGGGSGKQFDLLSISNIGEHGYARFFAHNFVAWIFVSFVFWLITREHIFYINLRQAYFFSPAYANRISSRTVLFSAVTENYLNKDKIRAMFGQEKVQNVWIASDTAELEEKVKERDGAAMKLEAAETKLIVMANKARNKALKKAAKKEGTLEDANEGEESLGEFDDESGSVAAKWVQAKDRPTHRLKFLIGKKVDTINWARSEIERLTPEIEELQAKHRTGDCKLVSSVFVEFYRQADAQTAYQSVAHNLPLHMTPRYIGLEPTQVIWGNLRIKWWERIIRHSATLAFVCAMIIFWAIPTAVVGAISNINYLEDKVHFLRFINNLPTVLLGLITGLLPTVLMSVLIALVPIILRLMAKLGGASCSAEVELTTQNWFFAFQIIQVFLVVTIASAATSVVTQIINNPSSAATLLSQKIPRAANFYISYIVLQGLSFSAGALLQIAGLIVGKILGKFLDKTPRKMYSRWSSLAGLGWGTVYPSITLLTVIGIIYSCIAPLVMGFGTIGIYLFYFAYRYNLLYVSNATIDTQGKAYVRALQHLTVGCYLLMICLIGLFAMGSGASSIAVGPLVLMIIFLIFVILYHISMNSAMEPLIHYLPKNMEHEEESLLAEERLKLSSDEKSTTGTSTANNGVTSIDSGVGNVDSAEVEKGLTHTAMPPAHSKPNFFMKFLRPDIYHDYATLRRLVPSALEVVPYSEEAERDAYCHPAITSQAPLLWIPRDPLGISRQEVAHTSRVIPITDEDAFLDENAKITWNVDKGEPPIYQEKIYY
ncbi:uncharacterized protein N7477_005868 [Penicillium maclennaniae]|uniref:uncharacterized protein n=1 Tax=Penicillium maclennaniae TaxID=1343394 RepID=UPI002540CE8A|nr:uncharacterized protein N7477_005868 [Penicillium maclennaniae]KAJ5670505.1 hypothetical protein N7477_005868 [Penicillium maclennaniae]